MAKLYGYATGNTLDAEISAKASTKALLTSDGALASPLFVAQKKFELSSQAADTELVFYRSNPGHTLQNLIVKFDALGGSVQLRVGDDGDDDRFITDFSASSAGVKTLDQDGLIDSLAFFYNPSTFSDATDVFVKIKSAAATGTVYATAFFTTGSTTNEYAVESLT